MLNSDELSIVVTGGLSKQDDKNVEKKGRDENDISLIRRKRKATSPNPLSHMKPNDVCEIYSIFITIKVYFHI